MSTPPFDLSAIARAAAAQAALPRGPRYAPLPEHTFPAPSLMSWMDLALAANVPVVPAQEVGRVCVEDVLNFEDPTQPGVSAALAKLDALNATLDADHMLRWDCCAGFGIKASLSDGTTPSVEDRGLFPDDPRAFDILYAYPASTIALVRRPWIKVQQIDGFPVEFRVFVDQGHPVGLANYYLQRALPDNAQIRAHARSALTHTRAIIAQLSASGRLPAMPGCSAPDAAWATLDFLVDDQGQLRFLEAGPGFGQGAHPCAFLNPDGRTVAPVAGLCLATGSPAISLAELEGSSLDPPVRRPVP